MNRTVLILVLAAFLVLTGLALWHHGYWGIIQPHFENYAGMQVFTDLVIALALFLVWMWRDAQKAGRNPLPWVLLTIVTGSIAPMVYLLIYKTKSGPTAEPQH